MEPSSPWDDIGPENENKEPSFVDSTPESIPISAGFSSMQNGSMLTGMAEMPPGQMIFLGPPSGAPKVVGILCTIYGVILFGSSALNIVGAFGFQTSQPVLLAIYAAGLATAGATIGGGVMLVSYQRRGVHLLFAAILVSSVLSGVELTMTDDLYDQMYEDGDLSEEEYQIISDNSGLISGIGMFMVALCGGICGLIVAIPLMVSNNGLDNSSLFG